MPIRWSWFLKWQGLLIFLAALAVGWVIRSVSTSPRPPMTKIHDDFRFSDVTKSFGINFYYEDPIFPPPLHGKERIFFIGGGVAVADVNGDGWMDFFLPTARSGSKNHLYINQQGHGFREAAEEWGVADTNQKAASIAPLFFDYDNDGKPDLFVAGLGCSHLFKNMGAHFEDVSESSGLSDCRNAVGAIPLDYDNDGFLDLYVLRYWGPQDFFHLTTPHIWTENVFDSKNGGRETLYRNRGDGTFEDVTDLVGGADPHWSYDAALVDLDGDGALDILMANDFGPDVFFSLRNSKLVDESYRLGVPDRRQGMSVSLGDLTSDGTPHVYVSNIYERQYHQEANFLWKFDRKGAAHDEAEDRGVENCGWAWGSAFADFNLDGFQDLYVANGMITSRDPKPYSFKAATLMTLPGFFIMDTSKWPPLGDLSWSGGQTDCIFMNRGDHFENASLLLGPGIPWDGRAVALIDFDNNGSEDLIVTTQNESAHLLKNEISAGNRWISFRLIGTKSNRDAVGARIAVRQGKNVWYRWATGGRTGLMATSDPRLHFGVPAGGAVDVEIRWPSSLIQRLPGLKTGKNYEVVEDGSP